jgi:hypothetical protein
MGLLGIRRLLAVWRPRRGSVRPRKTSTHVDDLPASAYRVKVDIEASAHKHGVHDDDMLHAYRHHLIAFATFDPSVTMFVGPSRTG